MIEIKRILCPIDLTPESEEALRYAVALARVYEAKLVLVRPDTHVAWRGNACSDGAAVWRRILNGELA